MIGGLAERLSGPIARRLLRGAMWSLLGSVLSRGLTFAATALVARYLGPHGFGELGTIQSTVGAIGVFAGFGLGLTATRSLAQWRSSEPQRAGRVLAFTLTLGGISGMVLALLLAMGAPWLAATSLNAPGLASSLMIAALLLPLAVIAGVQTGALAGIESFSTIALTNVLSGLVSFPALLVGVHLGGRDGAVWGLVATQVFSVIINHFLLVRRLHRAGEGISIQWSGMWTEHRVLWSFSLPAALASSMVMPVNWACIALLARQPDGYVQLGFFNAGNQWRQLVLFVPLQIAAGSLPVLAQIHASGDEPRFRRVALNMVATSTGLAAVAALVIVLFAPLMLSVFGSEFAPGSAALLPLMVGAVVITANNIIGSSLNARGDSWRVFVGTAVYGVISIVLTATIWGSDAVGLAWAQCVGSLVATVILLRMLWSKPEATKASP